MARFSDKDVERITRIKSILYCSAIQFLGTDGVMCRDFFIAGGVFANLWHFFERHKDRMDAHPAAYDYLHDRPVYNNMFPGSDIDFYVKADNDKDYDLSVKGILKHYQDRISFSNEYSTTAHAVTVDMKKARPYLTNSVQVIYIQRGQPEKVIDTFDMEHTKIYYDVGTNALTISPAQLQLVKNKKIIFDPTKCVKDRDVRLQKWFDRGWTIYKEIEPIKHDELEIPDDIPF